MPNFVSFPTHGTANLTPDPSGDPSLQISPPFGITDLTVARTAWIPRPWTNGQAFGKAQRSAEIAPLLNEVLTQPGWQAGNDIAFTLVHSCPADGYGSGCDSVRLREATSMPESEAVRSANNASCESRSGCFYQPKVWTFLYRTIVHKRSV